MVRTLSVILGLGLVVLFIAGLNTAGAHGWLTWLDLVMAICSFTVAGVAAPDASKGTRSGGPVAISIGLFALWIIALATGVVASMAWWNFAFACAFLVVGIAGGTMERATPIESNIHYRKSA